MSFYEYWQEQQAQKAAELRRQVEAAQCWIGRRVWIASSGTVMVSRQPIYGEVVSVDVSGSVKIVVGYVDDQPMYHGVHVSHLGGSVTLADA